MRLFSHYTLQPDHFIWAYFTHWCIFILYYLGNTIIVRCSCSLCLAQTPYQRLIVIFFDPNNSCIMMRVWLRHPIQQGHSCHCNTSAGVTLRWELSPLWTGQTTWVKNIKIRIINMINQKGARRPPIWVHSIGHFLDQTLSGFCQFQWNDIFW